MSETGEKTHAPTPKRLRDAVAKGDVLRSRDLVTAVTVLAGAGWLVLAGPWMLEGLGKAARLGLDWDRAAIEDFSPARVMLPALIAVMPPILVLGGAVLATSLVAQLGVSGEGRWIAGNLAPKGSRLNPLSGLKRMFGAAGWIELAKAIAKVVLLGAIAWVWGRDHLTDLGDWGRAGLSGQLALGWGALISLLFALGAGLVLIALIDFPVQWLRRMLRLKMSYQEMLDEHKESEGSPERKAAQHRRQRELAMGGVAHAMREAQFVLTNPTHFAGAMAYDPARAAAPIVLAKGRGDKALAMRELATELNLPCLEYPALARSVYYTTRERQVIREELYAAVAGVLAFVLSLKRGERPARPEVLVPVELRFDAEGRLEA